MSVSRKNKKSNKMKKSSRSSKSSKRSKNVRNGKKTQKHMKKMRGGAGQPLNDGVNQTVDFIIIHGDDILLNKNEGVTGNNNDYTLIGTYANSSFGEGQPPNDQKALIDIGIEKYNNNTTKSDSDLVPVTPNTALMLLKKKLKGKMNIDNITAENVVSVDDNKFHPVDNDVRLEACKNKPILPCVCRTQVFKVNLPTKADILDTVNLKWITYNPDTIFSSHKKILDSVKDKVFIGSSQVQNSSGEVFGFTNNLAL